MDDNKSRQTSQTVLTFEAINHGIDPGDINYHRKVQLLHGAMQKVGMQWYFF